MGLLSNSYMAQRYYRLGTLAMWVVPAVAVPTLRLIQDPPEARWKLFTRDFSTYSIGAGLFFLVESLAQKVLKNRVLDRGRRNLQAICAGVAANILFAGLVAPKSHRLLEKIYGKLNPQAASAVKSVSRPIQYVNPRPLQPQAQATRAPALAGKTLTHSPKAPIQVPHTPMNVSRTPRQAPEKFLASPYKTAIPVAGTFHGFSGGLFDQAPVSLPRK